MKHRHKGPKQNNSRNIKNRHTGIIKRHPDGFGFFIPDTPDTPDIYIPKQFMNGAMTNDRVEVHAYPEPGGNRLRGEIEQILERSAQKIIGKVHKLNDGSGLLIDNNRGWGKDLFIPKELMGKAQDKDLVIVEILSFPNTKAQSDKASENKNLKNPIGVPSLTPEKLKALKNSSDFIGQVMEVLGDSSDPQYDIKKVIIQQQIPYVFGKEIEMESQNYSKEVDPNQFKNRKDLREIPLITIDGNTAKDFDDAIFVETNDKGFRLIVAIADVSFYVRPNSAIDREAYARGTSTYFPNFVVPMLPEVLSNELCSLKPNVNRLCLTADIQFNYQGQVISHSFYEGLMKSHARVTYGEAQEVIDGHASSHSDEVKKVILEASGLAKILLAQRIHNGSLELEIPDTQVLVDDLGNPTDIQSVERIFSHRLIEEMMLSANVAVAKFLESQGSPALYRIHEPPDLESIETLNMFLQTFGSSKKLTSSRLQKDITKALQEFTGKPEETVLNILTLRSMNQAKYSPDNIGHFGLGFEDYCHFTSPIRRYPDLIIHRLLKHTLKIPDYEIPSEDTLSTAGTFLSACEQRSVKAERQVQSIKKARFMEKFLGEEFDGIISSITKFGAFVLIREYNVDGLIKIEDLGDDHFAFVEEKLQLVGRRSGVSFNIGDPLKIQVARCDVEQGQIDFVLGDGFDIKSGLSEPLESSFSQRPSFQKKHKNKFSEKYSEDRPGKYSKKHSGKHKNEKHFNKDKFHKNKKYPQNYEGPFDENDEDSNYSSQKPETKGPWGKRSKKDHKKNNPSDSNSKRNSKNQKVGFRSKNSFESEDSHSNSSWNDPYEKRGSDRRKNKGRRQGEEKGSFYNAKKNIGGSFSDRSLDEDPKPKNNKKNFLNRFRSKDKNQAWGRDKEDISHERTSKAFQKENSFQKDQRQAKSKRDRILEMLDKGVKIGDHHKGFSDRKDPQGGGKAKDHRRGSGKARISKHSRKG